MKMRKITSQDPIVRQTLGFKSSFINDITLYQKMYKIQYGDEISLSALLEEMARNYMSSDKDFKSYKDNLEGETATPLKKASLLDKEKVTDGALNSSGTPAGFNPSLIDNA